MANSSRLYRAAVKQGHAIGIASALGAGLVLGQLTPPVELQAALEKFKQEFQHGNLDRATELWTEDAREILPGAVLDRAGIRGTLESSYKAGISDFREEDREYFQGGDTIVETNRTVAYGDAGNPLAVVRYMTLWKKIGGRWRIHREIGIPVAQE
jgi:ketosteroid isomerase-like protein